jgi:hypothetical protein
MTAPDRIQITHRPRTMTTPRAELTSDDIPPGPLSEDDLRRGWNQQADEHNQWESLDSCEQLAWAQVRAIAADRARAALQAEPEGGEVGELVAWIHKEAIHGPDADEWRRAATLLQCLASPAYVVVGRPPEGFSDLLKSEPGRIEACTAGVSIEPLRVAPGPTFQDAIRLAEGCHDYSGGHSGAEGEAWHGAIDLVVDALKRAAIRPWDSQLRAVYGVGVEAQAGEVEV